MDDFYKLLHEVEQLFPVAQLATGNTPSMSIHAHDDALRDKQIMLQEILESLESQSEQDNWQTQYRIRLCREAINEIQTHLEP